MTNFADLAMGNAIFKYESDLEVGPHIRSSYTLKDTPAGPLRCEVWREIDMATGEPVLLWAAAFELDGRPVERWQLQDLGLAEAGTPPAVSPTQLWDMWAPARLKLVKDDRRLLDWPLVSELYADFSAWCQRRGMDDAPSLKAFSGLVRSIEGVVKERSGKGVHLKFCELVPTDGRPRQIETIEKSAVDPRADWTFMDYVKNGTRIPDHLQPPEDTGRDAREAARLAKQAETLAMLHDRAGDTDEDDEE